MTSAALKHALDFALELPDEDRAGLAHDLLARLDGPADPDAAEAWEAEIARRLDELESGRLQTVGAEEALFTFELRSRRLPIALNFDVRGRRVQSFGSFWPSCAALTTVLPCNRRKATRRESC